MPRTTSSRTASFWRDPCTSFGHKVAWTSAKRPVSARAIKPWRLARALAVGPGVGVEEGEARHPLGRLVHHLERDIAAHRQAGEREPVGRAREHAVGDRRHAVVLRMVADQDLASRPESRHLRFIEAGCAIQAGDED